MFRQFKKNNDLELLQNSHKENTGLFFFMNALEISKSVLKEIYENDDF